MNNEEAIRVLEEFKVIDDWTIVHLPEMEDAVDMAIEALQAKTDGDLISRQWLLDLYGDYIDGDVEEGKALFVQLEVVRQSIKDAPSAEPKMGKWENVGMYTVECSECKAQLHELEHANYCPNCGADMRGEEEHGSCE